MTPDQIGVDAALGAPLSVPLAAGQRDNPARAVAIASLGNALEWFDLIVFGFLSAIIAKQFFPTGDPTAGLLLTLASFGISFLMRPLGAVVLGAYADRAGRTKAMVVSVSLMVAGTAVIAFIPSYAVIGIFAPVGMVLARLLQGFSAGGEFGSATAFMAEQSPARRGFYSSWQVASQGLTTLLASGFGAVLTRSLAPEQLQAWGWRIPFMFGLLLGPLVLYMRRSLPEPAEFRAITASTAPLAETLAGQKARLAIAVGTVVLGTVSTYVVLFMPTYAVRELGLPPAGAFLATLATGAVQFLLAPLVGHLSDGWGRLPLMGGAALAMLLGVYPMFLVLVQAPSVAVMLGVQIVFGVAMTVYFAPLPGLLSDIFPTRTRTTGLSLGYNLAVTVFGGFAPFLIAWMIQVTGSKLAPSYYVIFAAAVSLAGLYAARRRLGLR